MSSLKKTVSKIMQMNADQVEDYIELVEAMYQMHDTTDLFILLHIAKMHSENIKVKQLVDEYSLKEACEILDSFTPKGGNDD